MAERSASITMPQNKPNDDKPASPASIATTSDGEDVVIQVSPTPTANLLSNDKKQETAAGRAEVDSAETKNDSVKEEDVKIIEPKEVVGSSEDTKVEPTQDATSNEGTPTPVKDAVSVDTRLQPKFSQGEEAKVKRLISRAHAAAQDTSTAVFKDDQDIIKLAEMVSQLTHLLAASGLGRDTTARAIAYVNGPDKLSVKAAIAQAKQDRRNKGIRRTSGAPRTSRKTVDGSEANDEKDDKKSSSEQDASTTSQSFDQKNDTLSSAIVSTSDEHRGGPQSHTSDGAEIKDPSSDQKNETAADQTNSQVTDKVEKLKKRFGRRKWGGWRRRNENKKNEGDKAGEGQEPTAAFVESTKEPVVTVEEQKDQPDPALVQVARAA